MEGLALLPGILFLYVGASPVAYDTTLGTTGQVRLIGEFLLLTFHTGNTKETTGTAGTTGTTETAGVTGTMETTWGTGTMETGTQP